MSGLSNAEIAQELVITLSTAKFHVSRILAKLNVSNRAEAVSLALQEGLVAIPKRSQNGS
jgi:DNA-binding NarL/FixJ family response regulator